MPVSRVHSVFAVDPGGTSGWAWGCVRTDLGAAQIPLLLVTAAQLEPSMFLSGQVGGSLTRQVDFIVALHRKAKERSAGCRHQSFVCESFVLRILDSEPSLLDPVRLIAMFDYLHHTGIIEEEIEQQSPSDAMNTVTDDRMKRWQLWRPGQPHRNDAVRHLVLKLRKLADA